MALGALLLAGALALFGYNRLEAARAGEAADEALAGVLAAVSEDAPGGVPDPYDPAMAEVVVDGVAYVGYLSIPDAGVELPVTSTWSYDLLSFAACRYSGSTKTDDLVIAAHNYALKYLGVLTRAEPGTVVYFTDADGVRTAYEVVATEVLAPTAVGDMTSGAYDLTLFSCTYDSANRVAIRCDRVP